MIEHTRQQQQQLHILMNAFVHFDAEWQSARGKIYAKMNIISQTIR
jgi:hypothetical protein